MIFLKRPVIIKKKKGSENVKDYKKIISANIKKYRREKGMTQKELADALGVKNTTVSMWEVGSNLMPAEVLVEVCRVLGVSLNEIGADDEKEKTSAGADARLNEFISLFSDLPDEKKEIALSLLKALSNNQV